jgi:hypothetical protein
MTEQKDLKINEAEENYQLLDTFLIRQGGRGNMQADLWFYESNFNMQFEIIEKIHKLKGVHYIIEGMCKMEIYSFGKLVAYHSSDSISQSIFHCLVMFVKWYNETQSGRG